MTRALVSVIVPAFNAEVFLDEALRSVAVQTYHPVEVIVIDDGSADRTSEIALTHDVRLLRQPHRGVAAARNTGLAASKGEFWTIFDADDVMPPERVARQVGHLEEHADLGMVLGLTEAFVTPGEPRPPHYNPVWEKGPYQGHPGTILARRRVFDTVGPFDENLSLGEDVDWLARATDAGVRAGQLDDVLLRYRIHQGNTSTDTAANRRATLAALRRSLQRRRAGCGNG